MGELKQMSDAEKYTRVLGAIQHEEYVQAFLEARLGPEAVAEYRSRYAQRVEPIPAEASPGQKYEIAYRNWMWISATAFSFVRERLGDEGLELMMDAGVAALKREHAVPSLYLLSLIRAISPGAAFRMIAKQSSYELQWLTPYTVEKQARDRVVMRIPHCKILDYPQSEDACLIGCQKEYPRWMAEQLKVKLEFERHGPSCTATVTPLH